MRALLCTAWGGPESLVLGEIETPEPGPGEVQLAIAAAGVNFADLLMIEGKYQVKKPFPFSPGLEAAGTVTAIGAGVTRVAPGDRVVALPDSGAFAEVGVAPEAGVFRIPDSMDFVTAAGFPVTYGTAHGALRWQADLKAGETLLVHGAAGGVGLATVEAGKALGATVIASAGGPDKLAVALQHGADHGIDYRSEDIRARVKALTGGRGADVVFDPVGGKVFEASLRCTAWGGRILIIGFAGGEVPQIPANILLVKNIAALGFYWGSYRQHAPELLETQFDELFAWYEAGKLKPHVSHSAPFEAAAEAMQMLKSRRSTGKVVITTG